VNANIDISLAKLSAPVEVLRLDRRACQTLRRARVYTVAEIVLRGKHKLFSIRNLGAQTAYRIWHALAEYLELSQEQLGSETASASESSGDVWGVPISILPLFPSTLQELSWLGYSSIDDLVRSRANQYRDLSGIDAQELSAINQHLHSYLVRAAQAHLLRIQRDYPTLESSSLKPLTTIASHPASGLPSDPARRWSVLELRTMQGLSAPEICARLGLSSSQVSGDISRTWKWLRRNLDTQRAFLDHLEERSKLLQSSLGTGSLDLHDLVQHLSANPTDSNLEVQGTEVERMILVLRSLAIHPHRWLWRYMEPKWPTLIWLSCLVEPAIKTHQQVKQPRNDPAREQKRKAIAESVHRVLAQARKPMHWSEVAEHVRQLDPGQSLTAGQVHRSLWKHSELFAQLGGGNYTLVEWGSPRVEPCRDLIRAILERENHPLPAETILSRVSEIRPVTRVSVLSSLHLNLRFYRSMQGTFGLRGWLPETLAEPDHSTPDWRIEEPGSLRRIERAAARGFDVKKLLSEDRLEPAYVEKYA
jgi:hypothetical protein